MATRSYHIMLGDDKKSLVMQYIHFDGYPSARVPILLKHYNTPDKVKALFSHGPASSLEQDGKVLNLYNEPNVLVPIVGDDGSGDYVNIIKKMIEKDQMPVEDFHYFWDGARWWVMEDLDLVDKYLKEGKIE